jgi:tetratricopeptide (TPR) repeat protein
VAAFTESLELSRRIGDRHGEAIVAFHLGSAFLDVPALRDLDQAEYWYKESFERLDESDYLSRATTMGQVGKVHLARFEEAPKAGPHEPELVTHLNAALAAYRQELEWLPADALESFAVVHNQLGLIHEYAGQIDIALRDYERSIRFEETVGNQYGAAISRRNIARMLANHGQWDKALLWAQAALRDFKAVGPGAANDSAETEQMLVDIKKARTR